MVVPSQLTAVRNIALCKQSYKHTLLTSGACTFTRLLVMVFCRIHFVRTDDDAHMTDQNSCSMWTEHV